MRRGPSVDFCGYRHLRDVDIETIEVIGRLCDPSASIEREHVQALGIAFLNAMRERSQMLKLIQRQPQWQLGHAI
jgi:hypothetical protein